MNKNATQHSYALGITLNNNTMIKKREVFEKRELDVVDMEFGQFKIQADEFQYILYRKDVTGKFAKKPIGYYTNIETLLKKMIRLETINKSKDINTLEEFLKKYREIMEDFQEKIIEPLGIE